ncbi:P-loop containing nucleoside triphosphate hydrolase protein [Helicostylum pulchrum]|uniref:P-loop containing nucleoside triphosphate hydrolase protein n=1 Tax=Helicostylum pulchrum TaxID=562976 RepID=A0ABP9XL97_9FUNG|nr:P-loop containing nucleoside triphosphate hydrolase protein [Helicostylum pulchrum]
MAPIKVICAGFGRTGTESLRYALNILGYTTHHMKCFFTDPNLDYNGFYHAYKHRDEADWDKLLADYDAVTDFSAATFYYDLHKKYPDAKVILNVRSADSWYNSVKNTLFQTITQLPIPEEGTKQFDILRLCSMVCLDGRVFNPEYFLKEEEIKQLYRDHIEEVKRNIPKEQLLVFELGEGWERVCKFLGKDVPDVPYPKTNTVAEFIDFYLNENRSVSVVPSLAKS